MTSGQQFERNATANSLLWMGAALISTFAASLLAGMLPLGLLLPAWQVRVSGQLLNGAPLAGVGTVMILLAHQLNPDSDELEEWVRRLRLWAVPAAIGFCLLVPLQTYNGYKLLRIASGEELQSISQLQKPLAAIRSARNEEELRAAISQIPGSPTNLGKIRVPFTQAKQTVDNRLSGQIKKLENQAEERNALRWQQSLITWAKNCLLSLCYGASFAEIGRFPKARKSLLFSILSSLPWNRRMRSPLGY